MKKIISLLLVVAMTASIAIGGTLAYLTDRESEANVFTVGNVDITLEEEFDQNSELMPGNPIKKEVQIKNVGTEPAYVWYTYAVPTALKDVMVPSFAENSDWTQKKDAIGTTKVGEDDYTVYAVLYNTILPVGGRTSVSLTSVQLAPTVDIDPDGELYTINAGAATKLGWNAVENENPVIFINAFAVQTQNFGGATAAYDAFEGQWGDMIKAGTYEVPGEPWDGTADTTWYNDKDTEFTITTAEQLAGLSELVSGNTTFAGKTIKLGKNIDLYCEDTTPAADGDPLTFRPIGDHSKNGTFEGTFDGQGYTISNLYQNGWDLGYQWGVYGSYGLFGNINNATIKNLTITGAESYIEGGDVGGITGSATGNCVFENITIEDSIFATYNNGCGGIIAWSGAGEYTFKNITIGENTVLAGLWGSFDSSIGGIVGQGEPGATYNFENVDIKCRLDVYNDCTASYDYYNYRMCGMIIGRLEKTTTIDGANYPDTNQYNINCNGVTVTYGDWANYHYCRATGARAQRVEAGYSYGGVAADYDHSVCTAHHMELIAFDQIFGGAQYAVKGLKSYTGVDVIYNNK